MRKFLLLIMLFQFSPAMAQDTGVRGGGDDETIAYGAETICLEVDGEVYVRCEDTNGCSRFKLCLDPLKMNVKY